MTINYQVLVLQSERPEWLSSLQQAISACLKNLGLHASMNVDVTEELLEGDAPALTLVLIGAKSKSDEHLHERIDLARSEGLLVVPVLDDLQRFSEQVPSQIARQNGFEWSGSEPDVRLAHFVLEQLGIEESSRRVFLSHRRTDGQAAAEQLHDALARVHFTPFIDRFAIPTGADMQEYIADALESFGFILVLETPEAHLSEWVFYEVDYALAHTMGLLILTWPGNPEPIPGSPGVPRLELSPEEIGEDAYGRPVLTEVALDRILREIEKHHAYGLVRRRRMMLESVREAMQSRGVACEQLRDWHLEVDSDGAGLVIGVAPRLPESEDLQLLDETRNSRDPAADAVLVHSSRRIASHRRRHLEWTIGARRLRLIPDNDVGSI